MILGLSKYTVGKHHTPVPRKKEALLIHKTYKLMFIEIHRTARGVLVLNHILELETKYKIWFRSPGGQPHCLEEVHVRVKGTLDSVEQKNYIVGEQRERDMKGWSASEANELRSLASEANELGSNMSRRQKRPVKRCRETGSSPICLSAAAQRMVPSTKPSRPCGRRSLVLVGIRHRR